MISQGLSYLIDQTSAIYHTAKDPKKYFNNYENIKTNIIPSINAQMKRYQDASYEAIAYESIEEFMKDLDLEKIKHDVAEKVQNNNYLINKFSIRKSNIKSLKTPEIEESKILNPENIKGGSPEENKSNLKDLKKYFQSKVNQLQDFEFKLIKDKSRMKKILNSNLDGIIQNYTTDVAKAYNLKRPIPKLVNYLNHEFKKLFI